MMTIQELAEKSASITHTYQVTPEVYAAFQVVSGDFNPLHTDLGFAKKKGFIGKVMYGNILNAFISHFVGMLLPSQDVMILSQDINFHKPVYLNDEITLKASIDDVSEAVGYISYKLVFYRDKERVAKGHVQISVLEDKNEQ